MSGIIKKPNLSVLSYFGRRHDGGDLLLLMVGLIFNQYCFNISDTSNY